MQPIDPTVYPRGEASTVADTSPGADVDVAAGFFCPACGQDFGSITAGNDGSFLCPQCGSTLTPPAPGIGPGLLMDDFLLIRLLGRGAMGEVYLAQQQSLSRSVAVKILAPGLTASQEQRTRFQREIQNLARLHHPNIVTAFYAGTHENLHYLAMSHVDGQSLQDLIHDKGALPEYDALAVAFKVAEALRYAWEQFGFLHHDIKPANIMIDENGEVKLTDLGLSRFVYEDLIETPSLRIFGTPHYMSPEQARGEMDLDFRSDMYSLGVTLYHMLTGHPPFLSSAVDDILDQQRHAAPPSAKELCPVLSDETAALLARLLAKSRAERYDSWDSLLYALSSLLARRTPVIPRPAARRRLAGAFTSAVTIRQRKRAALLGAALLAVLLLWMVDRAPHAEFRHARVQRAADQFARYTRGLYQTMDHGRSATRLRMQQLGGWAQGSYARRAGRRAEQLRAERVADVMKHLDNRSRTLMHAGRIHEAAAVYTEYDGPWAEESFTLRRERAEAFYSRGRLTPNGRPLAAP